MVQIRRTCALVFAILIGAMSVDAAPTAKALFSSQEVASSQSPAPIGGYAKGCMAGGVQLPENGPTWQAMRLSRNRNWALPVTIDYVQDLSRFAAKQPGWKGLYIGDMQQPRGGPSSGHRSHQSGLDVDIWMRPADDLTLSRRQRENISSISMQRANGLAVNSSWTRAHHEILKAAASDRRTARIFVFAAAKVQMCKDAKGDRRWLRKIRPWWGHHFHFHVRLNCPRGARGCVAQDPPPRGDGCGEAQTWIDNLRNPPPPPKNPPKAVKRREYVLADLPRQCTKVLQSK